MKRPKRGDASDRLSAFRAVLRHLDHPAMLCNNHLVSHHFADGVDPSIAVARVQRLIEHALDELPARQREIIRRCDFQGQSHSTVASALSISRRQFYRDRYSAQTSIVAALARADRAPRMPTYDVSRDAVALLLCYADAAHQAGELLTALRLLRDGSSATVDRSERIRLECRLAELCCEAGMMDDANGHIKIARQISCQSAEANDVMARRIDAVEATVAWRSGDAVTAVQRAERALVGLHEALDGRAASADVDAIAIALLVLSERDLTIGKLASSRRKALEARQVMSTSAPSRPSLTIRAESAATLAYMFDLAHLRDAVLELNGQYRDAIARGLTLEATLVALRLCNLHRYANAPERAAAALERILPVGRQLLTADECAGMYIDLASAYVACGQPHKAHGALREARRNAVPGAYAYAVTQIIGARACVLETAYAEALALSSAALVTMQRLERSQSIGSALRVAADANYALGEKATATQLIRAALPHLTAAHPIVVAEAYRSAAKITGSRVHRRTASEISSMLKASVS